MPDLYDPDEELKKQQQLPSIAPAPASANSNLEPTPTGIPPLQELRSGDASTYSPDAFKAAQAIPVIRGTADSSIVPDKITSLSDLANAIKGLGLDRVSRPGFNGLAPNADQIAASKDINANRTAQLSALASYANAGQTAAGHVESSRIIAEGRQKATAQETLLGDMMKKQDLEKSQTEALGQFQQSLVGNGMATLDAKSGKATFADPRYQKIFDDYAGAVRGVADKNAIQGINEQFQKRLQDTSEWVKLSNDKVLKSLPDDLMKYGQDLIPQGTDVVQAITNLRTHLQRDPATAPESKAALSLVQEIQKRKQRDTINKEQQAQLQKTRATVSAGKTPPVWAAFAPDADSWPQ